MSAGLQGSTASAGTHASPASQAFLDAVASNGDLLVSLSQWHVHREILLGHPGRLGLWLEPAEGPELIAADLPHFALVAVNFPVFTDGRGYSTARLLRQRYGYQGELRAVGDVFQDVLFYLKRCGFDAFLLRDGEDAGAALAGLDTFSEGYQTSVERPEPLFRRRQAATTLATRVEETRALLRRIADEFQPVVMASSLGAEDMVLTDLIYTDQLSIDIFTLDTGRLPEPTHRLLARTRERYGRAPRVIFPGAADVERFVADHGINGFYDGVDQRKACCRARKVLPLKRALAGQRAWITGLRREQSPTRAGAVLETWDADHGLTKFNPLAEWTDAQVWEYLRAQRVPYNALHDQGYASIGCAPCTRAVAPGDDPRSGRWWWEHPETKECGLHVSSAATT